MQNLNISTRRWVLFVLVFCGIFTSAISAYSVYKPEFTGEPKLKSADKAISEQFKLAAGSNRLIYFEKLQILIKALQVGGANPQIEGDAIGSHTTTKDEIIYLFGEPDQIIQNTLYQYNLNATGTCKAVVGINKDGLVTFSVIKGC
ncbi:MAG: hypothetical protein ACOVP1_04850 [Bacteroidia bacterium]